MERLSQDTNVTKEYESGRVATCRYNYILTKQEQHLFKQSIGGGNLYLGIDPNWTRKESTRYKHVVIEYNPNKVSIADFKNLNYFTTHSYGKIGIMSLDIAIDLYNYMIEELIIHKRHGSESKYTIEHSSVETIYLGAFGKSGHCKIYNKAKEQKINDGMKWTRIEMTYKWENGGEFMDIRDSERILCTKFPEIFINDNSQLDINFNELKPTDKYLFMTSLGDGANYLGLLDYRARNKIKELHKKLLKPIVIDISEIVKIYKEFKII